MTIIINLIDCIYLFCTLTGPNFFHESRKVTSLISLIHFFSFKMPASGRYTRSSRFRVHGEPIRPEGERQRRHSVVGGDTTVDVASIMTQLEIARKARVITLPPPPESTCFGYTRDRFVCLCGIAFY